MIYFKAGEVVYPLGTRCVIEVITEDRQTESGLLIPDREAEKSYGVIAGIGAGVAGSEFRVGQRVLWLHGSQVDVQVGERKFAIVRAENILAAVETGVKHG